MPREARRKRAAKYTLSDKEIKNLVLKKYHLDLALFHHEASQKQAEVLKYLKKLDCYSFSFSESSIISASTMFSA